MLRASALATLLRPGRARSEYRILTLTNHNKHKLNMQTEIQIGPDRVMDVRSIPCSVKHGFIIKTWLDLPVGGHFILLNDHDPVPLHRQFSELWPEAFTWQHLEEGPREFRVKITKLKELGEPAEPIAAICSGH